MKNRDKWALSIGRLILAASEVEWLFTMVRRTVFDCEVNKTWLDKSYSKKLEWVQKRTAGTKDEPLKLIVELLERARKLLEFRNHVAHALFAINTDIEWTGDADKQTVLHRWNSSVAQDEMMTLGELHAATAESEALSHEVSRALAIWQMAAARAKTGPLKNSGPEAANSQESAETVEPG